MNGPAITTVDGALAIAWFTAAGDTALVFGVPQAADAQNIAIGVDAGYAVSLRHGK